MAFCPGATLALTRKVLPILTIFLLPLAAWCQTNASVALQKADSLRHAARYDSSNTYYQEALQQFEKERAWQKKAETLYKLSLNKTDQDNLGEASQHLDRAFSLSQTHFSSDSTFRIKYLHQKAIIAEAEANYDSALKLYRQGKKLVDSPDPESLPWKIKLITGIGEIFTAQGKYEQATEQLARAEALYQEKQLDRPKLLSRIYNSRGIVLQNMGSYGKALRYYRQSLEIDRSILPQHHPDLAKTNNNIAIVYYYQSDYKRALDHMKNAVSVLANYHGENHRVVAAGYNNVGIVYSEMGELENAIEYLEKALEIKQKVLGKDHPDIAIGYQNLGAIYYDLGNYDRAISYYKQSESLHLKRFPEGHPELANVYANLGQAYVQKEKYNKALTYYQKDLKINRELLDNGHPFIGDTYTKIGEAYARAGNYQKALNYYRQAADIFAPGYRGESGSENISLEKVIYPAKLLTTLRLKAEANQKYGRQSGKQELLEESLRTYLQAVRLINELQQSYSREESKFLLRKRTVSIYRKAFETAYLLHQQTGNPDYKEYAFYFAEQSQNQILLDHLQKEAAESFANIPDSLISRENTIRSRLANLQQQLSNFAANPQAGDSTKRFALQDSMFHLRETLHTHIQNLETSYPKYYQLKYEPVHIRASELQKKFITDRQTVIRYFFGQDNLFALVMTDETFDIQKLSADSLLREKVKSYRTAITETSSPKSFARKSHDLYAQLLKPLNNLIQGDQLLIIPDGILHYLPFESLVNQTYKGENPLRFQKLSYLVQKYVVSYAPTANYLKLSQQPSSPKGQKQFVGFAPTFSGVSAEEKRELYPHFERSLSSLPLSRQEVREIQSLLNEPRGFLSFLKSPNDNADIYVEERATEGAFKNLSFNNYRYIHLATHAFISEDKPMQSGILFTPSPTSEEDGTLYASEIYTLSLDAELVILSACKTGVGKIAEGEGIISLSRAFQYAGARNLLVSLWNVDDRATARLMTTFYEQHPENSSISSSLQTAKEVIIAKKRYAHPKYWAPFIFIGQ